MTIEIKAITAPLDGEMTPYQFIAYVARVSNPKNQNNHATAEGLLNYCMREKHWSPFEMVDVVVEINTTRDIARQILRHRSFSFQEFSQRYAAVDTSKFILREARLQDTKNRQNSIEIDDHQLQIAWANQQKTVLEAVAKAYQWALDNNIAKEQARCVLPEGNTPSRLYMKGSLRSWIHYCDLRMGNGTQKEHAEIAKQILDQLIPHFPFLEVIKCKNTTYEKRSPILNSTMGILDTAKNWVGTKLGKKQ